MGEEIRVGFPVEQLIVGVDPDADEDNPDGPGDG